MFSVTQKMVLIGQVYKNIFKVEFSTLFLKSNVLLTLLMLLMLQKMVLRTNLQTYF